MSSFLCNAEHLTAMLHFLHTRTEDKIEAPTGLTVYGTPAGGVVIGPWYADSTWVAAGDLLMAENYRALAARYGSRAEEHFGGRLQYTLRDWRKGTKTARGLSPVEAIKAARCYQYQIAETENHMTTTAHQLAEAVKELAIDLLPGYDDAPWGVDQFPLPEAPAAVLVVLKGGDV